VEKAVAMQWREFADLEFGQYAFQFPYHRILNTAVQFNPF
jgi:hypothetical protein